MNTETLQVDSALLSEHKTWPRRLLHVQSLTSLERENGNIYGGKKEPRFSVLSYTWGRWEVPAGPSLPIIGVDWRVPSIDPGCFTVDQFRRVLSKAALDVDYVWLDVACIDQERHDVKMDEVGNQAGIFNRASEHYIWLHGLDTDALRSIIVDIIASETGMEDIETDVRDSESGDILFHVPDILDDDETEPWYPRCLAHDGWVRRLYNAVELLTSDAWFSSMWTLQESFLEPTAKLLSREGEDISRPPHFDTTAFVNLLVICERAREYIVRALARPNFTSNVSHSHAERLQQLIATVEGLGCRAHNNPILLYTTANRRTCRESEDRIYAIMQVFNFRLGAARDPSQEYTLHELETEFGLELNKLSPIWAQLFVHEQPAEPGRSWCVTQTCELPLLLNLDVPIFRSQCQVRHSTGDLVTFHGKTCSFRDIARQWKAAAGDTRVRDSIWGFKNMVQVICLDNSNFVNARVPHRLLKIQERADQEEEALCHEELLQLISTWTNDDIRLLFLGVRPKTYDDESDSDSVSSQPDALDPADDTGNIGLLVRKVSFDENGTFERIGVAVWRPLGQFQDVSIFKEDTILLC